MNLTSPKNWKTVKLGDVASIQTGPFGSQLHESDYVEVGVPMITVEHLFDDRISHASDIPKVSVDDAVRLKKYTLQEGDIVFSRVGSVDRLGFVSRSEDGWMFSGRLLRVRPHGIDPKFAFYALANPSNKAYIRKIAVGATMPSLNTDLLTNVPLSIPESLDDQREIAAILSSLDDKIELLRRENKTLESIAQALFREWFVELRFPGYEGVKVDGVPEGWRVGKLGDVCINFDSKRVPLASDIRAKRKGIYPYYGATQIMDHIDNYLFDGTYLLLAEDASVMDDKGFPVLQYVEGQFWVSNHAHVLQSSNTYSTEMLYLLMRQTPVAGIVTGAVQLKINQENLLSLSVIIPTKDISDLFNQVIIPQFQKLKVSRKEIQTLSRLRDQLLDKIFSN